MKTYLWYILLLLCCFTGVCQAAGKLGKAVQITVKSPGTLPELVKDKKYKITNLMLSGTLNGTDLRYLREMAGSDFNQQPTPGKLVRLDMSDAAFTKGGEPYINYLEIQYIKDNARNTVPDFAFRNCRLKEVIMKHTSFIGDGAFEYIAPLQRVVLPEDATLSSYAFNECPKLTEVVFPELTLSVNTFAFRNNTKLEKLELNNVNYLSGNGFVTEMPALKSFTVKGYLVHIDGWNTFLKCPSLETIDFIGPVLSTGGPQMVTDCPKLHSVTFHSSVVAFALGEGKNSPNLKSYTVKGLVFFTQDSRWARGLTDEELRRDPRYMSTVKQYEAIIDKTKEKNPSFYDWGMKYLGLQYYYIAKQDLQNGNETEAYNYLKRAVESEYVKQGQVKHDAAVWNKVMNKPEFKPLFATIRLNGDYVYCLQQAGPYKKDNHKMPAFTYAPPSDTLLTRIRKYFNLDSVAGKGDEISRIKNLMYWVHDNIRHDGTSSWPQCRYNAIDLYKETVSKERGLNCRFLAMVLNDFYLAMGYPSRFISCIPRGYKTDPDSHVLNMVWSKTLNKWIWMDPSFAAYVSDDKGNLLNHREVRERIRKGLPMEINADANWNHKSKQTKKNYLYTYMAKNLYVLMTHAGNRPESESFKNSGYDIIALVPEGFSWSGAPEKTTHDDEYFWQKPASTSD